jgi:hypothetical protein
MIPQEIVFQAVPYVAGLASGVLVTTAVSLRMMRKAGAQSASRCAAAARAMLAARQPAGMPAPVPAEVEIDDAPPAALAKIAERRTSRRLLRAEVAAREFIAFMRERRHTGWFAAEHIDEAFLWFCSQTNTIEIDPTVIRAELAAIKACRYGQRRLRSAEFAALREELGRDRAHVYFIPPIGVPIDSYDTAASAAPVATRSAARSSPENADRQPPANRVATGTGAAAGQKTAKNKGSARAAGRPGGGRGFDFVPGADLAAA